MKPSEAEAIVIGSGPNGLAAAITIASAGCAVRVLEANETIGGGARSAELTLPRFLHDLCSAVHPLAIGSPFFRKLRLQDYGLHWIQPPIALAHPLDDGSAACLMGPNGPGSDEIATAASLGLDGPAYRRLMRPLVREWTELSAEFLQPLIHFPKHPLLLARFGLPALAPASTLARFCFKGQRAQALFAGIAAHSFLPLEAIASAAFGLVLGAAGEAVGWPFPRHGAQAISNALAAKLHSLGGTITTGCAVNEFAALPKARALLFDTTCWEFARLAHAVLPNQYRQRLERFPHAPGVFKIDYALSEPVPWTAQECRSAGTVHLGGTLEEIAAAERAVAAGRLPERPFVLVAQQSLFDRTRAPTGGQTLWSYCHVPSGTNEDMTERVERQIERFAPGFGDCVLARRTASAPELERENRNLIGGDINGGASNLWRLIARPLLSPAPYRTPVRGVYICSSSTPPGGGVHGMCGYHAARTALQDVFGIRLDPEFA